MYSGTFGSLFKCENAVFNGEQEKESISHVRVGYKNPSLWITVCQYSANLVMPNGDPRDGFSYPTLTLMMDSYSIQWLNQIDVQFLCQINQIFTPYPFKILIFLSRGRSVVGLLMVVTCTPDVPEKKKSVDTEVEYIVDLVL